MIRRVSPESSTWVRAAFLLHVENATLEQVTERINMFPDGGGVLRQEVAQLQFDSNGPICAWLIRSQCSPNSVPDVQLLDILQRLEQSRCRLQEAVKEGALAEFIVCVLGQDFAVPFALSSQTVRRVAEIPASLRVFFTGERRFLTYSASFAFDDIQKTSRTS